MRFSVGSSPSTRSSSSFSISSCMIVALLLTLYWNPVESLPYFLLTSTRTKCIAVLASQGNTVNIEYYAPDIKIPSLEEEEMEARKLQEQADKAKDGANPGDGMDAEWNQRLAEKLERMRAKNMRDMSITVSQSSLYGSPDAPVGTRSRRNAKYISGRGRIREELKQRSGLIKFQTNDMDGKIDICMQSIIASTRVPSRIALNITMEPTEAVEGEDGTEDSGGASAADGGTQDKEKMKADDVKTQMGRFERDIATLKSRVKSIINNADFNKDQQEDFHEQSVAMSRAASYWPMIHLMVILVAGFTQANHIVTYMKTRHIV